ncbi:MULTISPECIES: hypothetical protein [unclassified Pseudomonas]|nr:MULTISPECIES: hypothetical protein [unclassified Pseudomonas]
MFNFFRLSCCSSHLEVIGSIIVMLNKGAKGKMAEGADDVRA